MLVVWKEGLDSHWWIKFLYFFSMALGIKSGTLCILYYWVTSTALGVCFSLGTLGLFACSLSYLLVSVFWRQGLPVSLRLIQLIRSRHCTPPTDGDYKCVVPHLAHWTQIWTEEKNIMLPKVCALAWGKSMEKGKTSPLVKPYFGLHILSAPVKVGAFMFSGEPKNVNSSQMRGWNQAGTQASSLSLSNSSTLYRISCRLDWPPAHCTVRNDLEFQISLPSAPECWKW